MVGNNGIRLSIKTGWVPKSRTTNAVMESREDAGPGKQFAAPETRKPNNFIRYRRYR